jgi:hypothetical protein
MIIGLQALMLIQAGGGGKLGAKVNGWLLGLSLMPYLKVIKVAW